jgi:hypothetical protein
MNTEFKIDKKSSLVINEDEQYKMNSKDNLNIVNPMSGQVTRPATNNKKVETIPLRKGNSSIINVSTNDPSNNQSINFRNFCELMKYFSPKAPYEIKCECKQQKLIF